MPHHHPLRRPSTGSLSSLARSQDRPSHTSPSGLEFLQPALSELTDEAATLASNIAHLTELHDALGTFNESFAGWLYALKMNAFCVEWGEAPSDISFARMPQEEPPRPSTSANQIPPSTSANPNSNSNPNQLSEPLSPPSPTAAGGDMTYATVSSSHDEPAAGAQKGRSGGATAGTASGKRVTSGGGPAAAGGAKKTLLAMKRKRELEIAGIIDTLLPLEYRGGQPALRKSMEQVIGKLMDQPDGLPLKSMISLPDLPQPRVNKCLIALVGKKLVTKANIGGTAFYRWVGA